MHHGSAKRNRAHSREVLDEDVLERVRAVDTGKFALFSELTEALSGVATFCEHEYMDDEGD